MDDLWASTMTKLLKSGYRVADFGFLLYDLRRCLERIGIIVECKRAPSGSAGRTMEEKDFRDLVKDARADALAQVCANIPSGCSAMYQHAYDVQAAIAIHCKKWNGQNIFVIMITVGDYWMWTKVFRKDFINKTLSRDRDVTINYFRPQWSKLRLFDGDHEAREELKRMLFAVQEIVHEGQVKIWEDKKKDEFSYDARAFEDAQKNRPTSFDMTFIPEPTEVPPQPQPGDRRYPKRMKDTAM